MSDAPIVYRHPDGTVVFRASAADRCTKELVAMLMEERPVPGDGEAFNRIAAAWAAGHENEPRIIQEVRSRGWMVYGEQRSLQLEVAPGIVIAGHIDGLAYWKEPVVQRSRVAEFKAFAQSTWDKWKRSKFIAFPSYAVQIAIYMEALKRQALYVVLNKATGEYDFTELDTPPTDLTATFKRLKEVVRLADAGELPVECDRDQWPCAFPNLHELTEEEMNDALPTR